METNVIYNEDCYVGIKSIPDNSIDLVIIDPPYDINTRKNQALKNIFTDNVNC